MTLRTHIVKVFHIKNQTKLTFYLENSIQRNILPQEHMIYNLHQEPLTEKVLPQETCIPKICEKENTLTRFSQECLIRSIVMNT